MKRSRLIAILGIGGILFASASALLITKTIQKHYNVDEYIPEEKAYYGGEITDPTGLIKAHKFVTPTDNKYNSQKTRSLGVSLIGDIESVWSSYTGKGTTIAIIDDGFDINHPEFRRSDGTSAILSNSRYYYASGSSYNYQKYSDNPSCIEEDWETDSKGNSEWATHGTATSTTAAAPMNNNGGVGIAPEADILALKIDFSFASIDGAIRYAVSQGVDVINMSLGAYSETFTDGWGDQQSGSSSVATYLNSACNAAYNAGIIVVAAAGNESTWHKSYPACNSHVVGVGALGDWDHKGNATALAEFTNYVKSTQTGEINVDILAPGYVYTAEKAGSKNSPTHTYADTQGTSFSSPIVAGAACLWKQKNPNGTPDQFLSELQASADGIGYYENKYVSVSGWDSSLSDVGPSAIKNGRLNIANLLDISEPYVSTIQSTLNISVGEKHQIDLDTYNGTISYSSANTNVATVSNSGLVEGKSAGSTEVTVTATKNGHTATAKVTVNVANIVAATSIAFNPKTVTLDVGDTYNAEETITVTPSNASRVFMFESEDESVVTVNEDTGLVTAIGSGTTNINVITGYGDGFDTLAVTVNAPSQSGTGTITFGNATGSLNVNGTSVSGNDSLSNSWTVTTSGTTSFTPNAEYSQIGSSSNAASSINFEMTLSYAASFTNVSASFGGFNNSAGTVTIKVGTTTIGTGSITSNSDVTVKNSSTASGTKLTISITNISKGIKAYSISYTLSSGGVTPTPKTLSSISISGYQTAFTVGDTFVFGGTVTAHYSDSTSENVTSSATFSGYNMSNTGNQTVTVSYTYSGTTKTATYQITVSSSSSGDEHSYKEVFDYTEIGDSWTLTNYDDANNYLLCPNGNNSTSVALLPDVFDGKEIASDVVITINNATYGSGSDPTSTTFSIYREAACSNKINATQSGALPTSSTYKDTIYTVSKTNAIAGFENDLVVKITKPGKQVRIKSITVEFDYEPSTAKVINSLSATYTGGDIYVGGSLNESALTVTASYTDSVKFPSSTLKSAEYSLSGFSSETAGTKTVTVTYTGTLATSQTPMTTTFNATVINDVLTNVNVTCSKSYHPGETIVKGDITVTLTYQSGAVSTTTDFNFASDGYQFTYADAISGGASTQKQFAITYQETAYNFNVAVSRTASQTISSDSVSLTGAQGANAGITGTTADGMSNYASLNINGITCSATNIYVYLTGKTKYFSFGKGTGELRNIVATASPITSVAITSRATNARSDEKIYVSNNGTSWTLVDNADLSSNNYYFFKVACETTSSSYSNFNLRIDLSGQDNVANVSNYIMYEDTNNQCVTKLDLAISKLNSMSSEDKSTFWTSNNYVIKSARERLEAWARHEHKELSYNDDAYSISSAYNSLPSSQSDNSMIVVLIAAVSLVTIVGGWAILKKKKIR